MKQEKSLSARSRKNSFAYAFSGIWQLLKGEPNAKIHAIATIVVIVAGFIRHIGHWQWTAVIFAIGLVWITEAVNTSVEKLCDFACGENYHPAIKIIKDVSAGAVLIAAMVSVCIGIIVFIL